MYRSTKSRRDLKMKRSFLRKIFIRDYNLGFGTSVTDDCFCSIEITNRIKTVKDNNLKQESVDKDIQMKRREAFLESLNEEEIMKL